MLMMLTGIKETRKYKLTVVKNYQILEWEGGGELLYFFPLRNSEDKFNNSSCIYLDRSIFNSFHISIVPKPQSHMEVLVLYVYFSV